MSTDVSRREVALVRALDNMARMADDDVPLFHFEKVFRAWIKPQSVYRKARILFVLETAVEAIKAREKTSEDVQPKGDSEKDLL